MNTQKRSALLLGLSVLTALALLGLVNHATEDRIKAAKQQWMLDNLSAVLPEGPFDQNPVQSVRRHIVPTLGSTAPLDIYTAYKNGVPAAAVLELIAPDGYNGNIVLMVGIKPNGEIIAARVIEHRETPGLGDDIEYRKSPWITQFDGQSLAGNHAAQWQTKKNGGKFDALTGATVTSRAVIQAIHRALKWYEDNSHKVFTG